jgi:signal transduction histidine kinase/ActR/RegA family two-component response regulator
VSSTGRDHLDGRVLVLPPTAKDGETTESLLAGAGISVKICGDAAEVSRELPSGAGALLFAEEAIPLVAGPLTAALSRQPPWSDLPILVLTQSGADSAEAEHALRILGNVTLLERPVRVAALVSAIRSALRARQRQYQIRAHLEDRARAESTLREADRRKDEFLATLGHELRNPLSPLVNSLNLIQLAGISNPEVMAAVEVMRRQVAHLLRLVNDLLEVSRITRGLIEVTKEAMDLRAIVRAAIDHSRHYVETARHQLWIDLGDEPLLVEGDAVRLTQVFSNLVNNAAKYTNVGGHIWLTAKREGKEAVVEVRDDGIGIARENLNSIFDMFTQVDRTARRTQGGLGIGLTLVRSLVDIHGGSVGVRSEGEGRGSAFEVRLPITDRQSAAAPRERLQLDFAGIRMLVADDNRDAADTFGDLLRTLGGEVSVVHDGLGALRVFNSFRPQVVLLDIGMPFLDGYEVARRIRAAPGGKEAILVAVTGWGQSEDVHNAERAGFDHHLVKPPDIDELWNLLRSDFMVDGGLRRRQARNAGRPD